MNCGLSSVDSGLWTLFESLLPLCFYASSAFQQLIQKQELRTLIQLTKPHNKTKNSNLDHSFDSMTQKFLLGPLLFLTIFLWCHSSVIWSFIPGASPPPLTLLALQSHPAALVQRVQYVNPTRFLLSLVLSLYMRRSISTGLVRPSVRSSVACYFRMSNMTVFED